MGVPAALTTAILHFGLVQNLRILVEVCNATQMEMTIARCTSFNVGTLQYSGTVPSVWIVHRTHARDDNDLRSSYWMWRLWIVKPYESGRSTLQRFVPN